MNILKMSQGNQPKNLSDTPNLRKGVSPGPYHVMDSLHMMAWPHPNHLIQGVFIRDQGLLCLCPPIHTIDTAYSLYSLPSYSLSGLRPNSPSSNPSPALDLVQSFHPEAEFCSSPLKQNSKNFSSIPSQLCAGSLAYLHKLFLSLILKPPELCCSGFSLHLFCNPYTCTGIYRYIFSVYYMMSDLRVNISN